MSQRVLKIQEDLWEIGFGPMIGVIDGKAGPRYRYAVKWFQRGYSISNLKSTGYCGPRTRKAIGYSSRNGGVASTNFTFKEFASKGNGHIHVYRELVRGLEKVRRIAGHGITVISGYRDPLRNQAVGGASQSQHIYGKAADVGHPITLEEAKRLKHFSGLGYKTVNGRKMLAHGDVRHVRRGGFTNFTNGTPDNPTVWSYD